MGVPNISPLESNLKRVFPCPHTCLSRRSVSEDGSRRNVMKTDHAHHFVMSSPFTSSVASAKEDGCTKILALLRAISRGFFYVLFLSRRRRIGEKLCLLLFSVPIRKSTTEYHLKYLQYIQTAPFGYGRYSSICLKQFCRV